MLNFFKRRFNKRTAEHDPLAIRDLLEYPQLRAAMGLDPLPEQSSAPALVPVRRRPARVVASARRPVPVPMTRSAA